MATEYGKRLRQARKYAKLTQVQLSEKTGIPQSTISTAEREGNGSGETPVYANATGVNALWLATGEGEMLDGRVAAALTFTAAAIGSTAVPTPPADYSPDALRLGKWFDKLPPDNFKTAQVYQDCMQLILDALHDLEQTPAPDPVAKREKRPA